MKDILLLRDLSNIGQMPVVEAKLIALAVSVVALILALVFIVAGAKSTTTLERATSTARQRKAWERPRGANGRFLRKSDKILDI